MAEGRQGFVKFFGQGTDRSPRGRSVLDAVRTSGSYRFCTYPGGRRPRAVRDGDLMFMGQLVGAPNDIVVYGRAIARRYEEGRDDAGAEELARRPWLERWPHFIRVHDLEFVDGALGDGLSLNELMDELGPYALGPTAENADRGVGNVDPRRSIRQAAAIRLSEAGTSWLTEELEGRVQEAREGEDGVTWTTSMPSSADSRAAISERWQASGSRSTQRRAARLSPTKRTIGFRSTRSRTSSV